MTDREQRKLDIIRQAGEVRKYLGCDPAPKRCSTRGGIEWAKCDLEVLRRKRQKETDPVRRALIDDEIRSDTSMIDFLSSFLRGGLETCAYTGADRQDLLSCMPT